MKRFFVDTENVGKNWIKIAEQNPYSLFYLVFSEHNALQKMNFEMFQKLDTVDFRFHFCETKNEKNALDYALVKLIRKEILETGCFQDEIYIISDDKGYDKHEEKFGLYQYQISITRLPVDMTTKNTKKEKKQVPDYTLTPNQRKQLRRICDKYHFSWAKKEMSEDMKREIKTVFENHPCNTGNLINHYFLAGKAKFENLSDKKQEAIA